MAERPCALAICAESIRDFLLGVQPGLPRLFEGEWRFGSGADFPFGGGGIARIAEPFLALFEPPGIAPLRDQPRVARAENALVQVARHETAMFRLCALKRRFIGAALVLCLGAALILCLGL